MPSPRFRALGPDAYVPDLIHLADVVLGKLGYGFVSECLTMGTPLIYVPRQNWPEERFLEVPFNFCTCPLFVVAVGTVNHFLFHIISGPAHKREQCRSTHVSRGFRFRQLAAVHNESRAFEEQLETFISSEGWRHCPSFPFLHFPRNGSSRHCTHFGKASLLRRLTLLFMLRNAV